MEDSLLDVLLHLSGAALLAAGLCAVSVVVAGALVFVLWLLARIVRGLVLLARAARAAYDGREPRAPREHVLTLPGLPHRLRRP